MVATSPVSLLFVEHGCVCQTTIQTAQTFYIIDIEEAKHKYDGLVETRKSRDKTSSGEIGFNIKTHAGPKMGQEQVSEGVNVPCRHAKPFAGALDLTVSFCITDMTK